MIFQAAFPRRIVFERGGVNRLPELLSSLGLDGKAMLITGRRFARESGYLSKLQYLLREAGIRDTIVFDKVEPNPSVETVEKGGEIARRENPDFVIGFGGGSAMDAAKGIAILATRQGRIRDFFYPAEIEEPVLPVIAIPTTCGTGSEVTKYAVISEKSSMRKSVIVSDLIVPVAAILDAEVLRHLPKSTLAHTAMDALSHAIEACFHVKASEPVEMFSAESMKTIFQSFKPAYDGDLEHREKLLYASMTAGLAINLSGSVFVHALGYYLTERYGIPHGLANSLFLTSFIEYCSRNIPERLLSLCRRLGIEADEPESCFKKLRERIEEMRLYANLPMSLKELGVSERELQNVVDQALSYGRNIQNCIVPPNRSDLEQMVKMVFEKS